jgi:hypothetical protein
MEDKETMEEHLMERNIEQFLHAGKTPFGYSDLGAELGHTGDALCTLLQLSKSL